MFSRKAIVPIRLVCVLSFLFTPHIAGLQSDEIGATIAWSSNGEMLAVADGNTLRVISVSENEVINNLPAFPMLIRKIAWSPNNLQFSVASGNQVQIWGFRDQSPIITMFHTDMAGSVSWSPNGLNIVSASRQNALVWDVDTGVILHEFTHNPGPLLSATWSPDGTRIATAGFDSQVLVWNASTFEFLGGLSIPRSSGIVPVYFAAWSPNSQLLATASADQAVRIWGGSIDHPSEITPAWNYPDETSALTWSPNSAEISRAGTNGSISIRNVATGETLETIDTNIIVLSLAYSPYGGRLAYGASSDNDTTSSTTQSLMNGTGVTKTKQM